MAFETILSTTDGPVATITLNRPEQLNTIVPPMPDEIEAAVGQAIRDSAVKVIVLRGAGRSFCAGYDFGGLADPEADVRLALAQAGDRPGPRLVRRRRPSGARTRTNVIVP